MYGNNYTYNKHKVLQVVQIWRLGEFIAATTWTNKRKKGMHYLDYKIVPKKVSNLYLVVGGLKLRSIIGKAFHIITRKSKKKLLLVTLKFLECCNLLLDPRQAFPEAKVM